MYEIGRKKGEPQVDRPMFKILNDYGQPLFGYSEEVVQAMRDQEKAFEEWERQQEIENAQRVTMIHYEIDYLKEVAFPDVYHRLKILINYAKADDFYEKEVIGSYREWMLINLFGLGGTKIHTVEELLESPHFPHLTKEDIASRMRKIRKHLDHYYEQYPDLMDLVHKDIALTKEAKKQHKINQKRPRTKYKLDDPVLLDGLAQYERGELTLQALAKQLEISANTLYLYRQKIEMSQSNNDKNRS